MSVCVKHENLRNARNEEMPTAALRVAYIAHQDMTHKAPSSGPRLSLLLRDFLQLDTGRELSFNTAQQFLRRVARVDAFQRRTGDPTEKQVDNPSRILHHSDGNTSPHDPVSRKRRLSRYRRKRFWKGIRRKKPSLPMTDTFRLRHPSSNPCQSLPGGSNATTDVAQAARDRWEALSDAKRKPYWAITEVRPEEQMDHHQR